MGQPSDCLPQFSPSFVLTMMFTTPIRSAIAMFLLAVTASAGECSECMSPSAYQLNPEWKAKMEEKYQYDGFEGRSITDLTNDTDICQECFDKKQSNQALVGMYQKIEATTRRRLPSVAKTCTGWIHYKSEKPQADYQLKDQWRTTKTTFLGEDDMYLCRDCYDDSVKDFYEPTQRRRLVERFEREIIRVS